MFELLTESNLDSAKLNLFNRLDKKLWLTENEQEIYNLLYQEDYVRRVLFYERQRKNRFYD
jgi:hypothetical protein